MRLLPLLTCVSALAAVSLSAPVEPDQESPPAAFSDFSSTEDDLQASGTISKLNWARPGRHRPHYVVYHVPHGHGGHSGWSGGHGGWTGGHGGWTGGHGGWTGGHGGWTGGHGGWTGGGGHGGWTGGWRGGWGGWRRRPGYVIVVHRPVTYGWVGGGGQDWGGTEYHGTGSQYQQQYTEYPQQYDAQEQGYGAGTDEYASDDMYSE
ncbi:ATP-dependent RNA helicase A-like [Amphibalanus amphitrite]|uniref:ATP-dependent RNA helicase A-like n=1 Tax=Amphibalanus amphitrite TaxID=1232801 RepID=UPI001C917165|nr:ATP-dependent RNA helicase A-like [Amphibalanus amphitrite]XP_043211101.1 ATP-dependent RNA helicase A-like [Amphibalanus amphitrite]